MDNTEYAMFLLLSPYIADNCRVFLNISHICFTAFLPSIGNWSCHKCFCNNCLRIYRKILTSLFLTVATDKFGNDDVRKEFEFLYFIAAETNRFSKFGFMRFMIQFIHILWANSWEFWRVCWGNV